MQSGDPGMRDIFLSAPYGRCSGWRAEQQLAALAGLIGAARQRGMGTTTQQRHSAAWRTHCRGLKTDGSVVLSAALVHA